MIRRLYHTTPEITWTIKIFIKKTKMVSPHAIIANSRANRAFRIIWEDVIKHRHSIKKITNKNKQ